ncbi:hypothetical protein [Nocardia farcinica]|uniref:hypothetical protein n=1 Tax=Nocardia farcinica TaxID=37329 RepID=UPI003CC7F6DC
MSDRNRSAARARFLPLVLAVALVLAQIAYPLTAGPARDRVTVLVVLLGGGGGGGPPPRRPLIPSPPLSPTKPGGGPAPGSCRWCSRWPSCSPRSPTRSPRAPPVTG